MLFGLFKKGREKNNCYKIDNGIVIPIYMKDLYDAYPDVARLVLKENVSSYKIQMLVQSFNPNIEIEISAIYDTMHNNRFPYICFSELEYDFIRNEERGILYNNPDGILNAIMHYCYSSEGCKTKLDYWKNKLIEMAKSGDLIAQGALLASLNYKCFSNKEKEVYLGLFEKSLWEKAKSGNPYAQIAVGEFLLRGKAVDYQQKIDWLEKAAKKHLTDAYFFLAKNYGLLYFIENNKQIDTKSEEYQKEHNLELYCYKQGAICDNGTMSAYCQWRLGEMYLDGEYEVQSTEKGVYWLEKAAEKGHEIAKHKVEKYKGHPEHFP